MMNAKIVGSLALAAISLMQAAAQAQVSSPHGHRPGGGGMGPGTGMAMPCMTGPGMTGDGMTRHGCFGCGMMPVGQGADYSLSTADAQANFARWLAWRGNPRLHLGQVKEVNADTITVDVVAGDNVVIERYRVNRHTGYYQPVE